MFIFFTPAKPAWGWNPDYAYELPKQKRMCVRRTGDHSLFFSSIPSDQACPEGTQRYVVVFGKEPKGSMALLATKTSQHFYPPLTLKWPPDQNPNRTPLWHFTCVIKGQREILGSKVALYRYRGEVTADARQDCLETESRALQYCQEKLRGEELLEACPLSWGK